MDKKKIKRIIAREGLILGCSVVISFAAYIGGFVFLSESPKFFEKYIATKYIITFGEIMGYVFFFLIWNYPIYLLIRFILWAIRTLREK
jgi:hypothetical protein